ncbi:hypothetical protein NEUTE1DRAFT_55310, partial [Neurospora tetrasperma FGSC 2508]
YKAAVNKKRIDTPKYKISDEVIFNIANYIIGRPYNKLAPRFEGPFRIIKANSYIVELVLPWNIEVTYIINISRVKPYIEGLPG